MTSAGRQRAIVIGAGIVGVCSAIELQRRGWAVTIVDRLAPGEGCSFGNAGILAAQAVVPVAMPGIQSEAASMLLDPESPLVVRWGSLPWTAKWLWKFRQAANLPRVTATADAMKALYGTSLELHETLSRQAGVPDLVRPTRYLYIARNPAKLDVENGLSWRLRRERGAEIEVLDGEALHEAEPELSREYKRGVRLGPIGYTLSPFRLTRRGASTAPRRGGHGPRNVGWPDGGRDDHHRGGVLVPRPRPTSRPEVAADSGARLSRDLHRSRDFAEPCPQRSGTAFRSHLNGDGTACCRHGGTRSG
jgi:D-amino-acid dehydrogenase